MTRDIGQDLHDLEKDLDALPEEVSEALKAWRMATLEREKKEALLYIEYKGSGLSMTATEIRASINSNSERYGAVLKEVEAESRYNFLYEKLLAAKKKAGLRISY